MNNWEDDFQPHILLRGWDYAEEGHVENLDIDGDTINAYVQGSEYYKVKIRLNNHRISKAYCSCPYFDGGNYCKHLAAVMYTASRALNPSELEIPDLSMPVDAFDDYANDSAQDTITESDRLQLEKIISSATHSQLEKLIIELMNRDNNNLLFIEKAFSFTPSIHKNKTKTKPKPNKTPHVDLIKLKADADNIFYSNSNRHGFIDYYKAFDFEDDICNFLSSTTDRLLDCGCYMDAFELSMHVFVKLGNTDIDDDGSISNISDCCWDIWKDVVDRCDKDEWLQIRQWFERHYDDDTVIDYMEDTLESFLRSELLTPEEMQEEMNEIDKELTKDVSDDWRQMCDRVNQVRRRVLLMKKLGASEEDALAFWFSHDEIEDVQDDLIDRADENENWIEEIRLINLYKDRTDDNYKSREYTDKLIQLYRRTGNHTMEKEELKHYIGVISSCPLETFREYKMLCSKKEWIAERDRIIEKEKDCSCRCILLAEEGLKDRLYDEIEKSGLISLYNKYGFALEKKYSTRILDFYKKHVETIAVGARNEARYREIISCLSRMQQYRGGNETVRMLAADLSQKYPTRKLMVKMLHEYC